MLRILGTKGRIEVPDFWFAGGREGGIGKIDIIPRDGARAHRRGQRAAPGSTPLKSTRAGEAIRAGKLENFAGPA